MQIAELRQGPVSTPQGLALGLQDAATRLNQLIRAFNELEGTTVEVTWDSISGKPAVFPADLSDLEVDWAAISGKPSTFAPSAHTHPWSQITARPALADLAGLLPASRIDQPFADITASGTLYAAGGEITSLTAGSVEVAGQLIPSGLGINMSQLTGANPPLYGVPATAGLVNNLDADKLDGLEGSDYANVVDLQAGNYIIPDFAIDVSPPNRVLISDMGGALNGIANGGAGTVFKGGASGGGITGMAFGQIVNADVASAAAIGWPKIDKAGSSLEDLATRLFAALTDRIAYGQLPNAGGTWDAGGGIVSLTGGLTTSGLLTVRSDLDTTTVLGRIKLSSPTTDQAVFSHIDHGTGTNYAVRQDSAGSTSFNTATGSSLRFCENNVEKLYLLSSKTTLNHTSQTGMSTGDFSIQNAANYRARNAAGTTNLLVAGRDSSDILRLGAARTAATAAGSFSATHYLRVRDETGQEAYVPCANAAW